MSTKVALAEQVLFCDSASNERMPADRAFEIVLALLERGYSVRRADALAGAQGGRVPAAVVVVGRRPDALPDLVSTATPLVDAGNASPVDIAAQVDRAVQSNDHGKPAWKPWFPVIDPARCTNCMQCLSFCLFDVYGVSPDAKITVLNPSNCKTDCPACARVCPEAAIVFPKYHSGPINGDEVSADGVRRESMKIDVSALLGGDIYSRLRDRSERAHSRFSKDRDDDRALEERQRCLAQLQQEVKDLDIPPEVMASLPSPDQIRAKAEAAQQKAKAALAQQSRDPAAS